MLKPGYNNGDNGCQYLDIFGDNFCMTILYMTTQSEPSDTSEM